MKFFVGVTDNHWFEFLAARNPDEANFWRPGGAKTFRALEPGGLFLFKLHSPLNYIAGGGFFVRHLTLPLSLAWDAFGAKNGAADQETFGAMVSEHRRDSLANPEIGCTILSQPFFLPRDLWVPAPEDWQANIVQGRAYDTGELHGMRLYSAVLQMMRGNSLDAAPEVARQVAEPQYGAEYLARARLGQGAFRVMVTEAYARRCAVTGERTLPVLQASHIQPFSKKGPNSVANGVCLRSDIHILFDTGYMTITPDYRVEVSRRIREEYENGRDYYALHGKQLSVLPERPSERPARAFIDWHNQNVYAA